METGSRQPWRRRHREREELRGRMSEILVPEVWADALSRWCQNVFLRACGQTKIKGNPAAEWHHTHMHAYTRLNGLSQFGFYNVTFMQGLQPP